MSMQVYYVAWNTWQDQQVQTPWEFWFLSEGKTLRRRSHMAPDVVVPDPDQIQAAWESRNTKLLDEWDAQFITDVKLVTFCLLYTSPSPRDRQKSRMPSSA